MAPALDNLRHPRLLARPRRPVRDDAARRPRRDRRRRSSAAAPAVTATTRARGARPTTTPARRPTSSRSTATRRASSSTSPTPATSRGLARLALEADVVVENFRPGVMDGFGLGYDDAARRRTPASIYCSITGFGARRGRGAAGLRPPGPGARRADEHHRPARRRAAEGRRRARRRARRPVRDRRHPRRAAATASATGEGQRVEVDLLSSLLAALVNQGSAYTSGGVVPRRMGNAHPSIAPYELFAAADGELVLAVGNDRQFAALCDVLGAPGAGRRRALRDERRARRASRARCEPSSSASWRRGAAADWAAELTAARVPAGVVNDIGAAFALAERARARSDRQHPARGRHVGRPHAQPDRAVGDPAGVPLGAAAVRGAGGAPGARLASIGSLAG